MKERFCRSDELKYLLLGERGCQVPSDFIVFRIFNFHFLYLYSYFFFEMRGTQVPCGIFFPFVSSLSLPPSLSLSTDGANIHEKEAKAYFSPSENLNNFETRNSNICSTLYFIIHPQKIVI